MCFNREVTSVALGPEMFPATPLQQVIAATPLQQVILATPLQQVIPATPLPHVIRATLPQQVIPATPLQQVSPFQIWASRDCQNVGWVVDGDNDAGSQVDFFPGFSDIDDVDTIGTAAPDVVLHGKFQVASTNVALSRKHLLDVFFTWGKRYHFVKVFCFFCL